MKNNRKNNMETLVLTGAMSIILTFSLLLLAAIVTDTDITLWNRTKAIPTFLIMNGLIWWRFWSSGNKREYKKLKKA